LTLSGKAGVPLFGEIGAEGTFGIEPTWNKARRGAAWRILRSPRAIVSLCTG